jgi:hypothetical protein
VYEAFETYLEENPDFASSIYDPYHYYSYDYDYFDQPYPYR